MLQRSLANLIKLAEKPFAKPDTVAEAIPPCLMELHTRSLPHSVVVSVEQCLHLLVPLVRVAWQPYSVFTDWKNGRSRSADAQGRLRTVIDQLRAYLPLIDRGPFFRPEGYTTSELRNEAEIGHSLWQKFVSASRVRPTRRGEHGRRFSLADFRKLIVAAESHDTSRARKAAASWRKLIA